MEIHFNQTYAFLILLLAFLSAFAVSFLIYKINKEDILTKPQRVGLSVLRFLAFFIIAILLLKPVIKRFQTKKLETLIVVATDNSESMQTSEAEVNEWLNKVKKEFPDQKLVFWNFGEKAVQNITPDFQAKQSDYSSLLKELSESYFNNQVAAVLLAGDGIFNKGQDPAFISKSTPFPVYTIGFGDTTLHVDAAIKKVTTNQQAFLNTYFPVELNIDFAMASGKQTTISIEKEGQRVYSKSLTISTDQYFYSDLINLKSEETGINNYRVVISPVNGETNLGNNHFDFSVNVVADKQKILLLGSGAHPDFSALKQTLSTNQNYEVEIITGAKPGINFDDYDLIIAHQLPAKNGAYNPLSEKLFKSNRPILSIVGERSSIAALNAIQKDIQLKSRPNLYENVVPAINEQFSLFKLPSEYSGLFSKFPPLLAPFGDVVETENFQPLIFQRIQGNVSENALILLGGKSKIRRGYILGEGIWRWRLYDYLQNGSHQQFDDFFLKIVNYLTINPGEDNFNIHYPTIFLENEEVSLQAELFNAANELVNDPEVEINFISEDSTSYHYSFDRIDNQYQLNAGRLPVGNYQFTANTELAGEKLTDSGAFRISPAQIEKLETRADFQTLNKIAVNTGGQFFSSEKEDQLLEIIKEKYGNSKQVLKQTIFQELLDIKWLFLLVVILFSVEWFLRKFWGTY